MADIRKTPRFEENLNNFGANIKKRIKAKIKELESRADDEVIQSMERRKFDPNFYILKIDFVRIPIQIEELQINGSRVKVFFLLDILNKEDSVYKILEDKTKKDERKRYFEENRVTEIEITQVKEELERKKEEKKKLKKPPEWLLHWLDLEHHNIEDEKIWIYESYYWVENTQTKNFRETYWPKIYNILTEHIINSNQRYIDHESDLAKHINHFPNMRVLRGDKVAIFYEYISLPNGQEIYFLYDYIIPEDEPNTKTLEHRTEELYNRKNNLRWDLSGYALRTYPDFILYDEDIWKMIEIDQRANLSLSAEEKEILSNAKLPIFINGQAGSGKSTLLFYMFANYLHKKIMSPTTPEGSPLFLTFNEKLVEEAKINIGALLKYHHSYVDKTSQVKDFELILQEYLNQSVIPYKQFLLNIVNRELNEDNRFEEKLFIGFNRFRKLYLGENLSPEEHRYRCFLTNKDMFSPELAWHVIRTYIKGYKIDQEVSPEEYADIPNKDKTVSPEMFLAIYDSIWKKWYQKLHKEHGFWDQQDLTRFVLNRLRAIEKDEEDEEKKKEQILKYPVIFCDEAQDFTRVELDFLLRINSFYGYDLSDLEEIPLAFAGDPFQTVNPSGFRWEFLQSTFYSKFKELQFPVEINDHNLSINFRSYPRLVKFGNLIQFFRLYIQDRKDLRYNNPLITGIQTFEGEPANLFEIGNNIDLLQVKKLFTEGNIFIVPADYGGEEEYVKKYDTYFPSVSGIENVFSPLRIKGMEHDKIVIFNFGEEFGELINKYREGTIKEDEMIQLQYAFNKIYVAITRAKKDLYIIDTSKGVKQLWQFISQDSFEKYIQEIDDLGVLSKWNKEVVDFWKYGDIVIFETDLEKIAYTLKDNGEVSQDSDSLRRAAGYYRRINDIKNEKECLAKALELEGKFKEAGIIWIDRLLNQKTKASECFWKGGCWKELLDLHEREQNLRYSIAAFMLDDELKNVLQHLEILFSKELHKEVEPNHTTWETVIKEIHIRLEKYLTPDFSTRDSLILDKLRNYFEQLAKKGFPDFYLILGKYSFLLNRYKDAIEYWDKTDGYNELEYFTAKFHLTQDINEKIKYAHRLNWFHKIIDIWQKHDSSTQKFNKDSIFYIKNAINRTQNLTDIEYIRFLMENFFDNEDYQEVIDTYTKLEIRDEELEKEIIDYIMKSNNWSDILRKFHKDTFLKNHSIYLLSKMLNIPSPTEDEIEFTMDFLSEIDLTELRKHSLLIMKYYCINKCYLRSFTRKTLERIKYILLENYLEIEYEKEKTGKEKIIRQINVKDEFKDDKILYALATIIVNNDEFYYSDRLRIIDLVIKKSEHDKNMEVNLWAKQTWLFIQNEYISWKKEDYEKRTNRSSFRELRGKITKREETQFEAQIRREKDKFMEIKRKWKQTVPEQIAQCPLEWEYIFSTNPFVKIPEEAEVNIEPKFYQLKINDFNIKVFKTDHRVLIINDEMDIHIRISMKEFYIESMGMGIKTKRKNHDTKEFSSKDSYVKGIIRKNGSIELEIDKLTIKIDLKQLIFG